MARKSKIETSSHYNEIVELLVAGYSGRYVSNYLLNKYNEKITHTTLNKYRKDNLNVKAAVKQKIIEKEREKRKIESQKKTAERKKQSRKKAEETAEPAIEQKAEKEFLANESFELASDYRYRDVVKLDQIIEDAQQVEIDLNNITTNPEKYDPYKERDLQIKYKKLGLDAMKLKYNMIEDDETTVNIVNNQNDFDDALVEELINATNSRPEKDSEE